MIIDGNKITGIFVYSVGIAVEKDDFLIHEGNIYVVEDDKYDGSVSPDHSIYCKLYVEKVNTDVVTTNKLAEIFNRFIQGVGLNGNIATISANDIKTLDKYLTTSVYNAVIGNVNHLFRVYVLEDGTIIQELIDYKTPTFRYRSYDKEWSEWKWLVSLANSSDKSRFDEELGSLMKMVNNARKVNSTIANNNEYMYCKRIRPDENDIYWTTDEKDILINLIVQYKESSQYYQTNVVLDPNAINDDNEGILPIMTRSGNEIVIGSTTQNSDGLRGYSFKSSVPIKVLAVLAINKY